MRKKDSDKLELLAPAGSIDAFFAAMENGADAVYCGLNEFSARAKAKNFTLAEVEKLTWYAHRHRGRLYVTLNTLLKEAELSRLIEILAHLAGCGVDGIIIQDLGVWRLARTFFPGLPLHASTQMTVHNAAGVRMLEKMGFVRAVLARELSLVEISEIRSRTQMELEHFVHGALCFSISGQCFFSSFLNGMSGNRGHCAQPCRRRYHNDSQPGYFFSTSDLGTIELLPELVKAGVTSFKIEGRMKSAEYVARVVAAYRLVLDAPERERKQALCEAAEHLALSFGRQTSKGFLTGFVRNDIAVSSRPGTLGRHLGDIVSLRDGLIGFQVNDRLHVGDRLRIQPRNDMEGAGFTVREMWIENKKVRMVAGGNFVKVKNYAKRLLHVGDAVFKMSGKPLFTMNLQACREKLDNAGFSPAATPDAIRETVCQAIASLLPPHPPVPGFSPLKLAVVVGRIEDIQQLGGCQADKIQVLISPRNLADVTKNAGRLARRKKDIIWEVPAILFETEWREYRRAVQWLAGQGYGMFRLNNLGHIPLFEGLLDVRLLGGFRCYTMNSQAALAWGELGFAELTLSVEDDRANMKELFSRFSALPVAVTIYSHQPVLLARIPIRGMRSGALLRSDRNEGFRVVSRRGLTEVAAEHDFSLCGRLDELLGMGCRQVIIDLCHCGVSSARGKLVLQAFAENHPLPDAFAFNYERGLA